MATLVALNHQGAEYAPVIAQRHAQPIQREGAEGLDLACSLQLRQGGFIHQERLARAEDVLGETAAKPSWFGPGIGRVHPVGEGDRIVLTAPEGDIQVLRRHEVPDNGVDLREERLGISGLDGCLGHPVGGLLRLFRTLAIGDVLGDGDDDLLAQVGAGVEPDILGEDLSVLSQAPELELLGLAVECLPEEQADPFEIVLARGGEGVWGLADEEGPRVAVHPDHAIVHIQEPALRILDVDGL